jgi:ketosteroid isomerase-like protein
MATTVPEAVTRYLQMAAGSDVDALVGCFTDDATVVDEGQTFRGHDEIRRWRETVTSRYTYTVTVLDSQAAGGDGHIVTVRLDGNFPGNTVELRFQFTVRDGLIASLTIAP